MTEKESIEQHVDRIREAILTRHGLAREDSVPLARNASAIEDAHRYASVSAHWGIASDLPVVGSALVLFRRIVRILLRWYINPIVEQQNQFNQAAVRALYELRMENENLRAELSRRQQTNERPAP